MIWVGLATLIMIFSGDGDLGKAFAKTTAAYEKAITEVVPDADRRAAALAAMQSLQSTADDRLRATATFSECLEAADRDYDATAESYAACRQGQVERWKALEDGVLDFHRDTRAALSTDEWRKVVNAVQAEVD